MAIKVLGLLFFLGNLSGCSSESPKPTEENPSAPPQSSPAPISMEAKVAGAQEDSPYVTEVKFEKNDFTLSPLEKKRIDEAITRARKQDTPKRIVILAWSDQERANDNSEDLPKADVDLAEERGDQLTRYFASLNPPLSTVVVNMAKKPSALKRFLKTKDVRIRETLDFAGKSNSKASKAFLIITIPKK